MRNYITDEVTTSDCMILWWFSDIYVLQGSVATQ